MDAFHGSRRTEGFEMRRVLLPVHLVSAVGLLGADLALAGLGITGATESAPAVEVYPAMSLVATWIMLPLGGVAIASGLALAWTQSAKFRPDWVRAKLLITLTLAVALVVVVAPGLADEAARAHAGVIGGNPAYAVGPAVSATFLVVNVVLGTAKPRRLFRRGPASPARSQSLDGVSG
jgi:hypothetical protein